MPSNAQINFGARFEYLKAIHEHQPDVLGRLHRDTFALYKAYSESNLKNTVPQTVARVSDALRNGPSSKLSDFERAFLEWVHLHRFVDAWILDALIQTVDAWANEGPIGKWSYIPPELSAPRFQPRFGHWIPQFTEWSEFKAISDAAYRRALANYRAEVRNMWGDGQWSLSQRAVWTVLWQQGQSPAAIQRRHRKSSGKTVSLAAIQQGVHEFAASAGVTLRSPRAGRNSRKI